MTTLDNDILQHHGVKGMKWGVRKKRSSSNKGKTQSEKIQAKVDRVKTKEEKAKMKVGISPISRNRNITLRKAEMTRLSRDIANETDPKKVAQLQQRKTDLNNMNILAYNRTTNERRIKWALAGATGAVLAVPGARKVASDLVINAIKKRG